MLTTNQEAEDIQDTCAIRSEDSDAVLFMSRT